MYACTIDKKNIVTNRIVADYLADAPVGYIECPEWVGIGMDINTPQPIPEATAEENKTKASELLYATDWTSIADIGNPQSSNPYLANQSDFIEYRNTIRQIAIYPTDGNLNWAEVPTQIWTKV